VYEKGETMSMKNGRGGWWDYLMRKQQRDYAYLRCELIFKLDSIERDPGRLRFWG